MCIRDRLYITAQNGTSSRSRHRPRTFERINIFVNIVLFIGSRNHQPLQKQLQRPWLPYQRLLHQRPQQHDRHEYHIQFRFSNIAISLSPRLPFSASLTSSIYVRNTSYTNFSRLLDRYRNWDVYPANTVSSAPSALSNHDTPYLRRCCAIMVAITSVFEFSTTHA